VIELKLPSLGADMDEGTLIEWKVKPGDAVKRGQIVAVVDTSKAAVDVESWQEGIVHQLVAPLGEMIPVGTLIATLLEPGESAPAAGAAREARPAAAPQPKPAAAAPAAAGATKPAGAVPAAAESRPAVAAAAVASPTGRRPVSPAARKHARELGIDIDTVAGHGPHGAVTLDDVTRAAAGAKPATAPTPAPPSSRQAEIRRTIAAAMSRSKREIPHYYLAETVPLAAALAWLLEANRTRPVTERLLLAALQLKAVALTLRDFPELNGHYRDGEFHPGAGIHLGVAVSLRQGGLIAPALHEADRLSLEELMRALADLVKRTRAGSLRASELSDATITVTNLGDQGVESVFGVIYPPQVALVGFGRMTERPWAEHGGLKVVPAVTATLAADHRVSDGHRGALFLAALRERLQQPAGLG
jgi:pyruvate dehydrogenase E2 component (dihydrolipoamide acetyltransferase)